jgi:hypothetical protein
MRGRTGGAPQWWLSTTRWAWRSAPLAGRFFSPRPTESKPTHETIVEDFVERLESTLHEGDRITPAAVFTDPPVADTEVRSTRDIRNPACKSRERVVLFVPRPITEADLLKENVKRAKTIRFRQRRRKRFRWFRDNVGTIVFVIGLFVLTWFVTSS